jgi:rubredoxin
MTEAMPPIPMRLNCPECGELHEDVGEFTTKVHHTHACQICGAVWRPAVVPTVGVRFLPGFKNAAQGELSRQGALDVAEEQRLALCAALGDVAASIARGLYGEQEQALDKLIDWLSPPADAGLDSIQAPAEGEDAESPNAGPYGAHALLRDPLVKGQRRSP